MSIIGQKQTRSTLPQVMVSTRRHSGQAQRDPESTPGAIGNEG
jgi:hypothetical protein